MKTILPLLAAALLLAGCDDRTFKKWDANRDGRLTNEEVPEKHRDHFDGADFDGDGTVSREEFEAAEQYLKEPFRLRNFQIVHDIPYAGTSNPKQMLDLWLPKKAAGRLPLLVYIHGGGWMQGDKSRGFLVASPLLHSGRYIGASLNYRLTDEARWPAQVHDCKAAIRWLRANAAKYGIDPDRIAIYGGSAGGHLASVCGLTAGNPELDGSLGGFTGVSTRVTCVVDFNGPANLNSVIHQPSELPVGKTNGPDTLLIGGLVAEHPDRARAASPVTYVSSNAPPFLIAHGTKDTIVSIQQSQELYEALTNARVRPAPLFIRVTGANHVMISRELMNRTAQFLDLHLYDKPAAISTEPIGK